MTDFDLLPFLYAALATPAGKSVFKSDAMEDLLSATDALVKYLRGVERHFSTFSLSSMSAEQIEYPEEQLSVNNKLIVGDITLFCTGCTVDVIDLDEVLFSLEVARAAFRVMLSNWMKVLETTMEAVPELKDLFRTPEFMNLELASYLVSRTMA